MHFGHQTRRWNPKMRPYIFAERNGIHIIDLAQTAQRLEVALDFVRENRSPAASSCCSSAPRSRRQEPIAAEAIRANMPFVNKRWLGGMLTNFVTIRKRIGLLEQLEARQQAGDFERMTKKEAAKLTEEMIKLQATLGGMRKMKRLPGRDLHRRPASRAHRGHRGEQARDPGRRHRRHERRPDELDYIIPANDDAIRAIRLLCTLVADAAIEGAASARPRRAEPEPIEAVRAGRGEEPARRRARRRAGRRRRAHLRARRGRRRPAAGDRSPGPRRPRRAEPRRRPRTIAAELAREAAERPTTRRRARPPARRPAATRQPPTRAGSGRRTRQEQRTSMADISPELVKELRERTGAGFMDCKRALRRPEATSTRRSRCCASAAGRGREEGGREAARASSRATSTPAAASACSSRSTARPTSWPAPTSSRSSSGPGDPGRRARAAVRRRRRHPGGGAGGQEGRAARRRVGREEAREHPPQIVEGQLKKWFAQVCLYDQPFRDEERTVRELITERIATIGENIRVRRFTRYSLGEDL
jgi:small subunit ribosomal protein S2